jgi:hypothetical protein
MSVSRAALSLGDSASAWDLQSATFSWRKVYREGRLGCGPRSEFVPALVAPEIGSPGDWAATSGGRIKDRWMRTAAG